MSQPQKAQNAKVSAPFLPPKNVNVSPPLWSLFCWKLGRNTPRVEGAKLLYIYSIYIYRVYYCNTLSTGNTPAWLSWVTPWLSQQLNIIISYINKKYTSIIDLFFASAIHKLAGLLTGDVLNPFLRNCKELNQKSQRS